MYDACRIMTTLWGVICLESFAGIALGSNGACFFQCILYKQPYHSDRMGDTGWPRTRHRVVVSHRHFFPVTTASNLKLWKDLARVPLTSTCTHTRFDKWAFGMTVLAYRDFILGKMAVECHRFAYTVSLLQSCHGSSGCSVSEEPWNTLCCNWN